MDDNRYRNGIDGENNSNNNLTNNKDSYNDNSDNSINNSYNINNYYLNFPEVDPMENSNNRTLLKSKVGKNIKIWAYAMNEYKRPLEDGTIRYTVINIHTDNIYIADHIQLQIPYELYVKLDNGEDIRRKIIMIDGYVKEYKDGEKQTIRANKIKISNANNILINEDYIREIDDISNEQISEVIQKYNSMTPVDRFELLIKYIEELNHLLPRMPRDFISNYIINQYMINYDPESINDKSLDMIKNDAQNLGEITFLVLSVIHLISDGVNDIHNIFRYITRVINDMQGLKEENIGCTETRKLPFKNGKNKCDFEKFCDKHSLNPKKAYRFIMNRNRNFGPGLINKMDAFNKAVEILYLDLLIKENKEEDNMKFKF